MKHALSTVILMSLLLVLAATPAEGQVLPLPIVLEARLGTVFPHGSLWGAEDEFSASGRALGFAARVHVHPVGGIYVGYQRSRFGCGRCTDVELDPALEATAFEAGLHLVIPYLSGRVAPWMNVATLRETIAFSASGERLVSIPAGGIGVGAGVALPVGRIEFVPGVRYQSIPARFEFTELPPRTLQSHRWGLDVGVALPL